MFSHCGFNLNAFDYYWDYTHHWPVIPLVLLLRIHPHSLQTLRMAYFYWFATVILFICEQVYVGVRGQPWVSFLKRHHLPCFLRWDLSPSGSSLVRLGWLATEPQGSTSLHLAALGLEAVPPPCPTFLHGIKPKSLCFRSKFFVNWTISPASQSSLYSRC